MDNRNRRPKLSREENARFVRTMYSSRNAICGGTLASFILDTAKFTEEVYRSRYRMGCEILDPELSDKFEVVWHLALLSMAQLYGGLTFEEVMKLSHIEIAGACYLVNPDNRVPMDKRIPIYAANLNAASDLVKITAFCRVLNTIRILSEDLTGLGIPNEYTFELAWLLREFKVFCNWSHYSMIQWTDCADIVNAWHSQGLISRTIPHPRLHFSLDATKRISDLRQMFED